MSWVPVSVELVPTAAAAAAAEGASDSDSNGDGGKTNSRPTEPARWQRDARDRSKPIYERREYGVKHVGVEVKTSYREGAGVRGAENIAAPKHVPLIPAAALPSGENDKRADSPESIISDVVLRGGINAKLLDANRKQLRQYEPQKRDTARYALLHADAQCSAAVRNPFRPYEARTRGVESLLYRSHFSRTFSKRDDGGVPAAFKAFEKMAKYHGMLVTHAGVIVLRGERQAVPDELDDSGDDDDAGDAESRVGKDDDDETREGADPTAIANGGLAAIVQDELIRAVEVAVYGAGNSGVKGSRHSTMFAVPIRLHVDIVDNDDATSTKRKINSERHANIVVMKIEATAEATGPVPPPSGSNLPTRYAAKLAIEAVRFEPNGSSSAVTRSEADARHDRLIRATLTSAAQEAAATACDGANRRMAKSGALVSSVVARIDYTDTRAERAYDVDCQQDEPDARGGVCSAWCMLYALLRTLNGQLARTPKFANSRSRSGVSHADSDVEDGGGGDGDKEHDEERAMEYYDRLTFARGDKDKVRGHVVGDHESVMMYLHHVCQSGITLEVIGDFMRCLYDAMLVDAKQTGYALEHATQRVHFVDTTYGSLVSAVDLVDELAYAPHYLVSPKTDDPLLLRGPLSMDTADRHAAWLDYARMRLLRKGGSPALPYDNATSDIDKAQRPTVVGQDDERGFDACEASLGYRNARLAIRLEAYRKCKKEFTPSIAAKMYPDVVIVLERQKQRKRRREEAEAAAKSKKTTPVKRGDGGGGGGDGGKKSPALQPRNSNSGGGGGGERQGKKARASLSALLSSMNIGAPFGLPEQEEDDDGGGAPAFEPVFVYDARAIRTFKTVWQDETCAMTLREAFALPARLDGTRRWLVQTFDVDMWSTSTRPNGAVNHAQPGVAGRYAYLMNTAQGGPVCYHVAPTADMREWLISTSKLQTSRIRHVCMLCARIDEADGRQT